MAARLAHQQPGHPLPRRSELAKRFRVSVAEIDAAIDDLVGRGLLRRLPSGQVHRAGPAEWHITVDGHHGLPAFTDPLDRTMTCSDIRTSRQRAPREVTEALRAAPGTHLPLRRCLWTADGTPAATSLTYVQESHAHLIGAPPAAAGTDQQGGGPPVLTLGGISTVARPAAVRIEIQPPARAVARRLHLASGQAAVIVTTRLDATRPPGTPAALTILTLRPELFRIVLDVRHDGGPAGAGQPA